MLIGSILIVIIVAALAGGPLISAVRFSQQFIGFKKEIQTSFYYGTKHNSVTAEGTEGKWHLSSNAASLIHSSLVDQGMGRVLKENDIPKEGDHISLLFGNGAVMDFYRYDPGDKESSDLIICYSSPDYGKYIYSPEGYSYDLVRAIVTRNDNKNLK